MKNLTSEIIEAARQNGYNMAYIDLHDILIEMMRDKESCHLLQQVSNKFQLIKEIRVATGMALPEEES